MGICLRLLEDTTPETKRESSWNIVVGRLYPFLLKPGVIFMGSWNVVGVCAGFFCRVWPGIQYQSIQRYTRKQSAFTMHLHTLMCTVTPWAISILKINTNNIPVIYPVVYEFRRIPRKQHRYTIWNTAAFLSITAEILQLSLCNSTSEYLWHSEAFAKQIRKCVCRCCCCLKVLYLILSFNFAFDNILQQLKPIDDI